MLPIRATLIAAAALLAAAASGCCRDKCDYMGDIQPQPLGTISDPVWQKQEENAEASDFVVYDHEFVDNTARLNKAGEEHVKRIAARASSVPFPIMIEPSSMSMPEEGTTGYPVHEDEELDLRRRELIVRSLTVLGVEDAKDRVVISPALAPGFQQFQAEPAYYRGMNAYGNGFGGGGFGGFGGGFGGGGFF